MRKLEDKYSDELVVIGVHSAKFDAERSTANIRQAVLRYGLEHPVVNDAAFEVWRRYAVRAWPTLMFIDPEGKVIGKHEGEIGFEAFDGVLREMVQAVRRAGHHRQAARRIRHRARKSERRTARLPGQGAGRPEQ